MRTSGVGSCVGLLRPGLDELVRRDVGKLEQAWVDLSTWLGGRFHAPFADQRCQRLRTDVGVQGGEDDRGGNPREVTDDMLATMIAHQVVSQLRQSGVVEMQVGVGGRVDQRPGQRLYRELLRE